MEDQVSVEIGYGEVVVCGIVEVLKRADAIVDAIAVGCKSGGHGKARACVQELDQVIARGWKAGVEVIVVIVVFGSLGEEKECEAREGVVKLFHK